MKKIIYLLVLLFLCSCVPIDYKYELTYKVTYPDTTWVNTYAFDGDSSAKYKVKKEGDKQLLTVYPIGGTNFRMKTICVVPIPCEISIIDFKIYTYGIDVERER